MKGTAGRILLAVAFAAGAFALARLVASNRDRPGEESDSGLPAARVVHPTRALILVAPATRSVHLAWGAYEAELTRWHELLSAVGVSVRVAALGDDAVGPEPLEVLVLPFAACLAERERALVRSHVEAGGGAVLVGDTGERDAACLLAPVGLLRELAGDVPMSVVEDASVVTMHAHDAPLAAGIPPDLRLELAAGRHFVLRGAPGDARYPGASGATAAQHFRVGHGRLAWLGFALSAVTDDAAQRGAAALLVRNAINWAAGHPVRHLAAGAPGRGGTRPALAAGGTRRYRLR